MNIGLIGIGTVGGGTYRVLKKMLLKYQIKQVSKLKLRTSPTRTSNLQKKL